MYATKCIELTPDKGVHLLTEEISINAQSFKETLLLIEDNQENPQSELDSISETIDSINDQIRDAIISQSVIIKSYDLDLDDAEDFFAFEELNEIYEQIGDITENLPPKTTLEELENTLAQLQLEVTLLNAQIAELRVQIETFIFTNEVIITAAIQEIAVQQLTQIPGIFNFEAIFDGVKGFETALNQLKEILDFFCEDLCKTKKFFWDSLCKKSKPRKRIRFINFPGIYKLTQDDNDGIIINSDNVIIDLNGHTIYSNAHTPLIISDNHKNIIIKNGHIKGGNDLIGAPAGILVNKGSKYILVENIDISFCHMGIHFRGKETSVIKNCKVKNCTFTSNNKDIELAHTTKTSLEK